MDVVSPEKRSQMMSAIKGRNTRPEMQLRSWLHSQGFRFRLHRKDLPGTPDIVLPGRKVAIFVQGCFWHRHHDCRFAATPSTRAEFWQSKFAANAARDRKVQKALLDAGWRVLVVWECGLRSKADLAPVADWILSGTLPFKAWPTEPLRKQTAR